MSRGVETPGPNSNDATHPWSHHTVRLVITLDDCRPHLRRGLSESSAVLMPLDMLLHAFHSRGGFFPRGTSGARSRRMLLEICVASVTRRKRTATRPRSARKRPACGLRSLPAWLVCLANRWISLFFYGAGSHAADSWYCWLDGNSAFILHQTRPLPLFRGHVFVCWECVAFAL